MPGQLQIDGEAGRRSSFEITVGSGQLLFSKLHSGTFPDPQGVLAAVQQFSKDGTIIPIAEDQSKGCAIQ